ncbi:DUF1559 domain-containing protein [Novipirellula rosea]|uniref:DUF1559 domain-containing protein n=1 Tax=Novipirellula rosea TaxID=1031540 RepID=A0ABP8N1H8_9BACT
MLDPKMPRDRMQAETSVNKIQRCGLTLIEIVVTVTLIAILIAILVPAIQAARESARKTQCQSNLKQTSLAVHTFHNSHKSFPSPYGGTSLSYPLEVWDQFHMHSWRAALLPYMEQSSLHDAIDWHVLATDRVNETVANTVVSSYICPSGTSPSSDTGMSFPQKRNPSNRNPEDRYHVVRSDYDALAGTGAEQGILWGVWGKPNFRVNPYGNPLDTEELLLAHSKGRFKDISDGLSQTIMVVERGGRPLHMVDGLPNATSTNPDATYAGQIAWSASNSLTWRLLPGKFSINHDNQQSIYSNHAEGVYVAMSDGSVTYLSESTDLKTLSKMIGRNDGTN